MRRAPPSSRSTDSGPSRQAPIGTLYHPHQRIDPRVTDLLLRAAPSLITAFSSLHNTVPCRLALKQLPKALLLTSFTARAAVCEPRWEDESWPSLRTTILPPQTWAPSPKRCDSFAVAFMLGRGGQGAIGPALHRPHKTGKIPGLRLVDLLTRFHRVLRPPSQLHESRDPLFTLITRVPLSPTGPESYASALPRPATRAQHQLRYGSSIMGFVKMLLSISNLQDKEEKKTAQNEEQTKPVSQDSPWQKKGMFMSNRRLLSTNS